MSNRTTGFSLCMFASVALLAWAQPSEAQSVRHGGKGKQNFDSQRIQRNMPDRRDDRYDRRDDRRDDREDRKDDRQDRREDRRDDRYDRRDDRWDHRHRRHHRDWDDWIDYRRRVAGARLIAGMIFSTLPRNHTVIVVGPHTYYYHDHVFMTRVVYGGRVSYEVIRPPIGAIVRILPPGYVRVVVRGTPYFVHDDVYYIQRGGSYHVVVRP